MPYIRGKDGNLKMSLEDKMEAWREYEKSCKMRKINGVENQMLKKGS